MIIIDKLKFVYVHIPKCAGTTIKKSNPQLEMTCIDNGHGYRSTHLPLFYIKKKDPETYDKVLNYDSYAHVRDPIFRFRSALFQHSREFLDLSSVECDDARLLQVAKSVIAHIRKSELPFEEKYEHFTPQYQYLEEDGRLVVKHIAPIGNFEALNEFYAKNGLNTIGVPQNVSFTPKSGWFSDAANFVRPIVRSIFPREVKYTIWRWLTAKGYYVSSTSGSVQFLLQDQEVMAFINDYYCRDFALFESVKKMDPSSALNSRAEQRYES